MGDSMHSLTDLAAQERAGDNKSTKLKHRRRSNVHKLLRMPSAAIVIKGAIYIEPFSPK